MFGKAEEAFEKLSSDVKHLLPEQMFLSAREFLAKANDFTVVELAQNKQFESDYSLDFFIKPQPSFNKQFDLLMDNLNENTENGYTNYLYCSKIGRASCRERV